MAQIHIGARISEHLKFEIESMAKERGIPTSAIVLEALYAFIKGEGYVDQFEIMLSAAMAQSTNKILARLDEMKPRVESSQEVETPKPKKRLVLKRRVSPIDDELTGEDE